MNTFTNVKIMIIGLKKNVLVDRVLFPNHTSVLCCKGGDKTKCSIVENCKTFTYKLIE